MKHAQTLYRRSTFLVIRATLSVLRAVRECVTTRRQDRRLPVISWREHPICRTGGPEAGCQSAAPSAKLTLRSVSSFTFTLVCLKDLFLYLRLLCLSCFRVCGRQALLMNRFIREFATSIRDPYLYSYGCSREQKTVSVRVPYRGPETPDAYAVRVHVLYLWRR
eukprot:scaffold348534_cov21-Prasinocladus_malaysianus.AAC.1